MPPPVHSGARSRLRARALALAPVILLAAAAPLAAQEPRRVGPSQPAAWFSYIGDHGLGAPTAGVSAPNALHLETQVRRVGPFDEAQQLLVRGAVVRTMLPGVRVAAGYAYIDTWPYGEAPVAARFPEHRTSSNWRWHIPPAGSACSTATGWSSAGWV